jgi:WD40 repeat protein
VCISADGKRIVSGSEDQTVKVWDADKGKELLTLKGHTGGVESVCLSADGKRIVSGSADSTMRVWDANKGKELLTLKGHTADVTTSVCLSADGKRIVSGSLDKTVKVWDADKGLALLTLKGHTARVFSVCISADGKRIVSGSEDQTVKVWDADKGKELLTLKGHTSWVSSVCLSADGKRIVSGGSDGLVKVWDADKGPALLTLKGHTARVFSVCISADGKRIVSGSEDQTVGMWDADKGQELLTLKGHTADVTSVCLSADGKRIVSGSWDKTVKLWDADKGQELLTLEGHTGAVSSVCLSADGKRIVSASADSTVKVWDADKENEGPPTPKVPIGKDTTYVTGPLTPEGFIAYEAALNERLGKSITPQKNANVLLWQALGPTPEGGAGMPQEFFKRLGIPEPPRDGTYYMSLGSYLKDRAKLDSDQIKAVVNQLQDRASRPWLASDYPHIAEWLKANEKPIALVIEATRLTDYFNPLIIPRTGKEPRVLIGARLPAAQKCRELAAALTARAMLRVAEGKFDEAWQDLLACHRLARLVSRGALVEALVGIGIGMIASNAELAYLERVPLTPGQIQDRLKELHALPPLPPLADKIDLNERLIFLDVLQFVRRGGVGALERLTGVQMTKDRAQTLEVLEWFDWAPGLRSANGWFDRVVAALRLKNRTEREKELGIIEEGLKALKRDVTDPLATLAKNPQSQFRNPQNEFRQKYTKWLTDALIGMMFPAFHKVQEAYDRTEQTQRNLYLAFGLAAYRVENGRYPAKLDELAPRYLAAIPDDLFSGKALIYRPSDKGYLLYSMGVNGKDDGGRSYGDEPPGDDLCVRMPPPELKLKK